MKRMGMAVLTLAGLMACASSTMAWHITGKVYCDNGDGVVGAGDTPLGGVTVVVTQVGGCMAPFVFENSAVTAADGSYWISVLDCDAQYCATLENVPGGAAVLSDNPFCWSSLSTSYSENHDFLVSSDACASKCWMTAGGVKFEPLANEYLAEANDGKGPNDSLGGNVYPSCSEFPGDGGHWNHVAHRLKLHLNGQVQHVIKCGNVPGTAPGTDSPVCDVNFIHWEGWGTISPINGGSTGKKVPVYYEAKVEDRAEPGNLKGAKNQPDDVDRYYIKVWYLNANLTIGAPVPGFQFGTYDNPIQITGGNLQIHCTSCD